MKKNVLIIVAILLAVFVCVIQDLFVSCASVKKETTRIGYYHHTNSGEARYTSVTITPDSLIWNYSEARNGVKLRDVKKYNRTECLLKNMLKILTEEVISENLTYCPKS